MYGTSPDLNSMLKLVERAASRLGALSPAAAATASAYAEQARNLRANSSRPDAVEQAQNLFESVSRSIGIERLRRAGTLHGELLDELVS